MADSDPMALPEGTTVEVNVRIVSEAEAAASSGRDAASRQAAIQAFAQRFLTPEQLASYRAAEPALLAWVRADPDNARRFVEDPVEAVVAARVPIDPAFLARVREVRAMQPRPPLPEVRVPVRVGRITVR